MPLQENMLNAPHVVLIPSAGMGHLTPFSRLAASLSSLCKVSMVSISPTVSSAESRHLSDMFSAYPDIDPIHFQLPHYDLSDHPDTDPFLLRWEMIGRSASEILNHITKASEPVSALVIDITLSTSIVPLAKSFGIPCYILFTASAAMLSFCAYFPTYYDSISGPIGDVQIPGLRTVVPQATIPLALHNPKHVFTQLFIRNGRELVKADGLLVNTFEAFEEDSLVAMRDGHVKPGFPPVIAVGPLLPVNIPADSGAPEVFPWLDKQPEKSVVYVSFGSRTAMRKEQIRELGLGLEASGCRFVWVVKTAVVDTHDKTELEEMLGEGFLERVKDRGLVVKGWVEQEELLRHKAVGGFVSHCGWNSVTEAALHGVKVLAWPRGGDQRINAGVVARSELGVWVEKWSWEGEEGLVGAAEIAERVKEMMADEHLAATAQKLGEQAQMAMAPGGTSYEGLVDLVRKLKEVSDAP